MGYSNAAILRIGLCMGFLLALGAGPVAADVAGAVRVIDGDTVEVAGERIRLHGIDAPENAQTCDDAQASWPCGHRATTALREAIAGQEVTCKGDKRDRYGRLIAVCYVGPLDLNAEMVRQGWALAYRRYSLDYVDDEEIARAAGTGVWQGRFTEPWAWRQTSR